MSDLTLFSFFSEIIKTAVENYDIFLTGLWGTLSLSATTVFFGTILGAVIALLKLSKIKVFNIVSAIYIEVLRGTPMLVQLYIANFFLPLAFPVLGGHKPVVYITMVLILNSSAYVAEIFRGGILSVDKGQYEAAMSLGMSYPHMMFKIVLPQAVKNILPALGNEFITMIKETSIASVFFVNELMLTRNLLMSTKFLSWQPLFVVAIIYLIVTLFLSKCVKLLEGKLSVSD